MYSYIKAFGKEIKAGSRWKEVDIKNITLKDIFAKYKEIYSVLSNSFFSTNIGFDLSNIRHDYYVSNLTFNQFLMLNENKALVHMSGIPSINTKTIKYADAFHAEYSVVPIHKTASISSDLPNSEKHYLHLSRDDTDYELFYKSCMVTINGYFHLTDYDTTGIYIVDGNKSGRLNNNNNVGLYSFRELGTLEFIPITESMISRQLTDIPLNNKTYIKLNQDISNKIPILVIGGYMHIFDENTFHLVNEKTISIDFLNYPFFDRYYESKKYIDLSPLPLQKYDRNSSQLEINELVSDIDIKALLTLPQSFIALLTADDIFSQRAAIDNTNMYGMMVSHIKPNLPLVTGYGRMADYWYTHEDGQYSINCVNDHVDMNLFNTTNSERLISITDSRNPEERIRKSKSYFLMIGKDISIT